MADAKSAVKILFNIWMGISIVTSLYYVSKTCGAVRHRSQEVNGHMCLENTIWIPPSISIFIFTTCVIGLVATITDSKGLDNVFLVLVILGFVGIVCYGVYMFALGYRPIRRRGPISYQHPKANTERYNNSYNNVYYKNSPLDVEYKLLLRKTLASTKKWLKVKNCFDELHFCDGLREPNSDGRIEDKYSRLAEGCCSPPTRCGLVLKNGSNIVWEPPKTGVNFTTDDADCSKWKETISDGKCYDCDTCKAAHLSTFEYDFSLTRFYFTMTIIFLVVTVVIAACYSMDDEEENKNKDSVYGGPPYH